MEGACSTTSLEEGEGPTRRKRKEEEERKAEVEEEGEDSRVVLVIVVAAIAMEIQEVEEVDHRIVILREVVKVCRKAPFSRMEKK